jgi:hypothetical protein
MKKFVSIVSSFFILSSIVLAQHVIENPEEPLSKNAGRVLNLQEVFRITDESGDFYFTSPRNLKVDSNDNFFIIDENQFLKFSADGKYLKNLFIKGQGPGEIATRHHSGLSYFILKDDIFLYDRDGSKIIRMDSEGNLIEEIRLKMTRLSRMYGLTDEGFIFMDESPANVGPTGFKDVDMSIILVSKDGGTSRTIMIFPKKVYSGRNFGMDWAPFYGLLGSDAQKLFVCHTCEYNIALADLNIGELIRRFNRKYSRVKYVIPEGLKKIYAKSTIKRPERKYENDILGLFFHNDQLWVKTSTKNEKKGVLIDVFNKEGKYIDNFYLNLKGELMAVHGDFIFMSEKDEDENIQIVKYKMIR